MYNPEKLATYYTQEEKNQSQSTAKKPLYTNNKEWLARNHHNVSEWGDMSIRGMSIQ
jgi:hypothetical protein